MVVLTLKAKHDHLEKVASTRDYVKALGEFVWNALDADASRVSVELVRNVLGGIESIIIRDNGSGISKLRAEHDFESLGESWKLQAHRTPILARAIHGKEGKGRLKFFSLAKRAQWSSVYRNSDRFLRLSIAIEADRLQTSNVSEPEPAPNAAETGTVVELAPLKDTFDWLGSEEARAEFNAIFAPYILQYPGTEIAYDGKSVDPPLTIDRAYEFGAKSIICPSGTVRHSTRTELGPRRNKSQPPQSLQPIPIECLYVSRATLRKDSQRWNTDRSSSTAARRCERSSAPHSR